MTSWRTLDHMAQASPIVCAACGAPIFNPGRGRVGIRYCSPECRPPCAVDGCDQAARTRGWCRRHYCRWLRTGDPLTVNGGRSVARLKDLACSYEGCEDSFYARGLCKRHYKRMLVNGRPDDPTRPTDEARFWSKVDKRGPLPARRPDLGPCWLWTASAPAGYGQMRWNGTMRRTHRIAYELLVGPIAPGRHLDHLCMVTRCCNPDHLEPVTPEENTRRMLEARRLDVCKRGHPRTPENVGAGRSCLPCKRERRRLAKEAA